MGAGGASAPVVSRLGAPSAPGQRFPSTSTGTPFMRRPGASGGLTVRAAPFSLAPRPPPRNFSRSLVGSRSTATQALPGRSSAGYFAFPPPTGWIGRRGPLLLVAGRARCGRKTAVGQPLY